jgi:23S rRNA G2445 N2-methylase RlmL
MQGENDAGTENNEAARLSDAVKPLATRSAGANSSAGQAVYDPFVGSGTTIIAAEMTGRSAHCIEISPAYVDVAVLRWQTFTGSTATHASTGRSFAETGSDRAETPAAA